MPPGRGSFQDVCHLTPGGMATLVDAWLGALD
jgi:hypothetical protein